MGLALLGAKYRTGVINDFSVVRKAVFNVLKTDPLLGGYTLEETLPVQINPHQISYKFADNGKVKVFGGVMGDDKGSIPQIKQDPSIPRDLSITLEYSLYDEYVLSTMDGMTGPVSEVTLMNETATSLKKLTQYAGSNDDFIHFYWGQIEFFGLLSEVSVDYTQFSRWGDPLRAKADVSIKEQPLSTDPSKSPMASGKMDLAKVKIKAYHAADDALNIAALGLSAASR